MISVTIITAAEHLLLSREAKRKKWMARSEAVAALGSFQIWCPQHFWVLWSPPLVRIWIWFRIRIHATSTTSTFPYPPAPPIRTSYLDAPLHCWANFHGRVFKVWNHSVLCRTSCWYLHLRPFVKIYGIEMIAWLMCTCDTFELVIQNGVANWLTLGIFKIVPPYHWRALLVAFRRCPNPSEGRPPPERAVSPAKTFFRRRFMFGTDGK